MIMELMNVRARITRCATDVIAQHGWSAAAVEQMCGRSGVLTSDFVATYPQFHDLFDDLYAARMTEIVRCIAEVATLSRAMDQPAPTTVSELVAPLLHVPRHYDAWWIASSGFAIRSGEDPEAGAHYVDAHNRWHEQLVRTYDEVGSSEDRSLTSTQVADAILGARSSVAHASALRIAQAERSAWLTLVPWADG